MQQEACMRSLTKQKPKRLPRVVSEDVITCARPWYLLLAQHSLIVVVLPPVAPFTNMD